MQRNFVRDYLGSFQSGQMGQTVNLLSTTSVVRIHHFPLISKNQNAGSCFFETVFFLYLTFFYYYSAKYLCYFFRTVITQSKYD